MLTGTGKYADGPKPAACRGRGGEGEGRAPGEGEREGGGERESRTAAEKVSGIRRGGELVCS